MTLGLEAIRHYLEKRHGTAVDRIDVDQLGSDNSGQTALKQFGYGKPLLLTYTVNGQQKKEVLHRIARNAFGRERDDDRVAAIWLDYTTFNHLPRHVPAIDMLTESKEGRLQSIQGAADLLLITSYLPGAVYAADLARIRDQGIIRPQDSQRAAALATYLATIHQVSFDDPLLWRRRLRDLIGHGEGIMGLADSYPADHPIVTPDVLCAIEQAANRWRWRLKPLSHRLRQVHGDFHPFNIVFDADDSFYVLDRSRGEWGEPADDVSCLVINYIFFSLQRSGQLEAPFLPLYNHFWQTYLSLRPDEELGKVIQPWLAWRVLVLASPLWYPTISDSVRQKMVTFAQRILALDQFDYRQVCHYLEA